MNRFHDWQKCSKCGRVMAKDRSLADCWLIVHSGKITCEHDFKPTVSLVPDLSESKRPQMPDANMSVPLVPETILGDTSGGSVDTSCAHEKKEGQ